MGGRLMAAPGRLVRAGRDRRAARAACLDGCAPLLDGARTALMPDGLPRLSGRRDRALWDVQLCADSLSRRKLPALWLIVARIAPRTGAALTVLRRPTGQEPFSGFGSLPCTIQPPPGFPPDCAVRAPAPPIHMPPPVALAAALDHPRAKELRLAPSGLRLVWLAEEGDRSRYLLFREAELARAPVPPAMLAEAMARLGHLAAALGDEAQGGARDEALDLAHGSARDGALDLAQGGARGGARGQTGAAA